MTAISVSAPFPILADIDGSPLNAGHVYIGQANLDPVAFPKSAYWDASLTTPAAQPIRTSGGYPVRNGSPARIYTDDDYSIRIFNKAGALVYSSPSVTDRLYSWQVGYDGGTVQDVLDGAKSLQDYAALRAYTGRATRIYITGLLATAKPAGIAGIFQYDPTDTTSADNGGTIIVGADGRRWKRDFSGAVNVKWFGAKGDWNGVTGTDDTAAIQTAINTGKPAIVPMPTSGYGYKTTTPLTVGTGQKLLGEGNRPTIFVEHQGIGIVVVDKGHVENLTLNASTGNRYKYTGVGVGTVNEFNINGVVHNVYVMYPDTGFLLTGGSYFYTLTEIDVFKFKNYGILLSKDAVYNHTPNKNNIYFKKLEANVTDAFGWSAATWEANVPWEQAAIKVAGAQNLFVGGEPAPAKYGVIVEAPSSGNRFLSMYMEAQYCVLKTAKGTETYWDSSATGGFLDIDKDSVVLGPSGNQIGINTPIFTAPIAAGNALKAAWFFDEGYGSTVYDRSGNGVSLTATNPLWTDGGRWGKTLSLDVAGTRYLGAVPIGAVDWTQPFTFAACLNIPNDAAQHFAITFNSGSRYASINVLPSYWEYIDYDGSTVAQVSITNMGRSRQDGHKWVIIYFDPVTKTLSNIDPVWGLTDGVADADAPRFSPWATGGGAGLTSVVLGKRGTVGFDGSFAFAGFWQRKLSFSEATDLVNMKVPNLLPSGAPLRAAAQSDSVAGDVATLKADFNALLAKFRAAGLLKT